MLLSIDDTRTIGDLQEKFNECFPFLKIEFYDIRHKWQQPSTDDHRLSKECLLGDIRDNHKTGIFTIRLSMKAGKLEQEFRRQYGLFVQVFYLMNDVWIQSVAADDLTLGQLMELCGKIKMHNY